ncbi:MAG: hypothetical protein IJ892_03905, partial [Prevotella sp.]|nr:hypothetical protein [Prevotella sp.]
IEELVKLSKKASETELASIGFALKREASRYERLLTPEEYALIWKGLYAMETAIKDLQAKGTEVLMTIIQPQPLYMLRTMDVIPDLIPERNTFKSFKACTKYLRKKLGEDA